MTATMNTPAGSDSSIDGPERADSTTVVDFPDGADLALSRATDFYGLDALLSEEELAIRDRVRRWCDTEVSPIAADYWERAEFPVGLLPGYAALGIAGGSLVGDGCPGLSYLAEGMIAAELARGDGSIATLNAVHSGLAMTTIGMLGSPEQRAQYLPRMAACEVLGAFALTEPNHGSDVVALETRAHRDGDEWVLTGEKRWIGNGTVAGIVVVWARDDDGNVGAFVVEHPNGADNPLPGYHARRIVGKAANRGVWQAQIRLDGVRIPLGARLAKANSWEDTNAVLAKSRQTVAWEALGHAIAAYEAALAYSLRRQQFGRPLARFQLIQDKLSHMLSDITSMQLVCTRMSQLQADGKVFIEHAALAKLNTGDGARRVCAMARDILGGNGILLDHHVARHHADIEAVYTYEGTDSIQSLIVGRAITGINAFR
jgi:glutaryl-CoA dehydrogenase